MLRVEIAKCSRHERSSKDNRDGEDCKDCKDRFKRDSGNDTDSPSKLKKV